MKELLIDIKGINKTFKVQKGGRRSRAEKTSTCRYSRNEFVCVVGPSGCGKTTLLNVIAGLEPFDSGSVKMDGEGHRGPRPRQGRHISAICAFSRG